MGWSGVPQGFPALALAWPKTGTLVFNVDACSELFARTLVCKKLFSSLKTPSPVLFPSRARRWNSMAIRLGCLRSRLHCTATCQSQHQARGAGHYHVDADQRAYYPK